MQLYPLLFEPNLHKVVWGGNQLKLTLKANLPHNELRVRFCYWDSCEERNSDDERFMLGRFTEHLLVHYSYFVDRVVIE